MTISNPFELLGNDDNDDPSQLIAAAQLQKANQQAAPTTVVASARKGFAFQPPLRSKPLLPSQNGRGADYEAGRGQCRDGGEYRRDRFRNQYTSSGGWEIPTDDSAYNGSRPHHHRRGGYSNGEVVEGERQRREFERRSGTGRETDLKRDGSGRGNWGSITDELALVNEEPVAENEKNVDSEKLVAEEKAGDASKENPTTETKENEAEDNEMTLEEYQKVLEEKRKALVAMKIEERKVELDKDLKAMQQLSCKKENNEFFAKLGSDKDKRKETTDKEEKPKKSFSINEFLKPADGESYYYQGGCGRGRGRGRVPRKGYTEGNTIRAPLITDNVGFPSLGA